MLNAAHHILARANEPAIRSRTAIHYAKAGRITQVSYAEFTSLVNRAANALKQLGAQRGERIPVLMNDAPLAAATMLAAMLIGAVPIPTNTKLRADEYAYIASDAGAKLFIADDEFLPLLSDVAGTRIIFIDTPNGFDDAFKSLVGRASSASFPAHTEADDAAFWLYSSGTTGKPKAIIHTHRSAAQTSKLLTEVMGITPESVVYCTSKLFFTFAFDNAFLGPLKAGAATVCTHEWADPDTVLRQIEAIRPTAFLSVPTFFRRVLALPDDKLTCFKAIPWFFTGGERLPDVVAHQWKARIERDLLVCYGMSETFCNTLSMRPDHVRYGSCGAPLAGVETKVLDRDGAPAPAGEAGVLWLKHPTLAQRYHRDEHNTKAFNDGWFCTNDQFRVELDEAGNPHWFHEGRADELLKIAGQWVKPSEVEEVALSYVSQAGDTIKEAACVVVTDASGFERLALYVVPAQAGISDAALAQSLRPTLEAKLPSHSLPRWIRGIDELPRTPTGKVQRFKLKAGFVVD